MRYSQVFLIVVVVLYLLAIWYVYPKIQAREEIEDLRAMRQFPNIFVIDGGMMQQFAPVIEEAMDSQNVHETPVRREVWEKFYFIKSYAEEKLGKTADNWYELLQEDCMAAAYKYAQQLPREDRNKITILLNKVSEEGSTIISTRSLTHTEKEVFSMVWYRFADKNLDINTLKLQLLDCFEEAYQLVCITGRISRYLNSFSGIDEDEILSTPEISQKILVQEALNKIHHYYDDYFRRNPKYIELRDKEDCTQEEEAAYERFLERVKRKINKKITKEFPDLEHNSLTKMLEGLA